MRIITISKTSRKTDTCLVQISDISEYQKFSFLCSVDNIADIVKLNLD